MIPVLLMAVLAAGDFAEDPEVAIFSAPLAIAGAAAYPFVLPSMPGGMFATALVFLPVGATFTAADFEWCADAALVYQQPSGTLLGYNGFWFGFGPMIHSGTRALRGFFFSPKLTVGAFRLESANKRGASHDQLMWSFAIGGDFGFQLVAGRLYVAFVLGVSVGAGWNEPDNFAGPLTTLSRPGNSLSAEPVVGLNLQLLRIGYAF